MTTFAKRCAATILFLVPHFTWAAGSFEIIAIDDGQGSADGAGYSAFSEPVLNERGQVAFVGFQVTGNFGEPNQMGGIYLGDTRGSLVKLIGVEDPGFVPDSTANFFQVGGINDNGQVAYTLSAVSSTGDSLGSAVYLDAANSPPLIVVKAGDSDPDGDVISVIKFTDLDSQGRVALRFGHPEGIVSNAFGSSAVFESEKLRVLAKEDQPAPDGIGVVRGAFFPSLNDAGQIHYSPRIKRPGLEERPALFRDTPGIGRELLFRSDDPTSAPNLDGTLLLESYTPSMNEAGALVFAGNISGATDASNNGLGLFMVENPGEVIALVREGQSVPGGDTFAGFSRPSLNRKNETAFYGLLRDDPAAPLERENVGAYLQTKEGLIEIAREGDPVPGGDGMFDLPRFNVRTPPFQNTRLTLNDSGQVVFLADLTGTASGGSDEEAIFFFDGSNLIEIIRTGSPLLDSTIVDLGLKQSLQNDSKEEDGFNDSGQIAFRFALEDEREGIALWSPDRAITSFNLAITRATSPEMGFDLEWDSEPGKSYDLVSSIDLATPISDWQVYDPPGEEDNDRYRDILADGSATRLTSVIGDGNRRFFAVIEKD